MLREDLVNAYQGLDDHAYDRITSCLPPLTAFINRYLLPLSDGDPNQPLEERTQLQAAFAKLEADVTQRNNRDPSKRRRGLSTWRNDYLLPLARELNLVEPVEKGILTRCLRRGWLTLLGVDAETTEEEQRDAAIEHARSFLSTYPFPTGKQGHIKLLHTEGLSPTPEAARKVAQEWSKREERAAGRARGAILDIVGAGVLGVLQVANYPYASEVLDLQRIFETIPVLHELPPVVQATVRRHIIAIRQVVDQVDSKLWRADILHQPANTATRQAYRKQFTEEIRRSTDTELAAKLAVEVSDACLSFDALLDGGWNSLIDHCLSLLGQTLGSSVEELRLQHLLSERIGALDDEARTVISEGVHNLRVAAAQSGFVIPERRLLRDDPNSRARRNFGKRLWFGMSAMSSRRQRLRRKSRDIQRSAQHISLLNQIDDNPFTPPSLEDKFTTAFVRIHGLPDDGAGRSTLRSVGWNGGVSLLPKDQWQRAVDPTIADYIELIKFGRLESTVSYDLLRACINELAQMHEGSEWSRQLVRAYYNSIAKQRRWNGGVGEIMAGVSWRATQFQTVRRLNARWFVVVVELRVPILDNQKRLLSDRLYVVLVIDEATERPLGCWCSSTTPGSHEVALALYQSIWHPWVIHWPIRGLPESLSVPPGLAAALHADFYRAVHFLLCKIEVRENESWQGTRHEDDVGVVEAVQKIGSGVIRKQYGQGVTCQQAQQALLQWLSSERWFPHHSIEPVPIGRSLALPGYNTPPAGWLLPRTGQVSLVPGGVLDRGVFYACPQLNGEQCDLLWKRDFPEYYPGKDTGLFVESSDGQKLYFVSSR